MDQDWALAYAEWLAVTYGDAGLRVSALCPQGVRTPLLMAGIEAGSAAAKAVTAAGELLEPDDVAGVVVEGLAAERFLVLPHPEVSRYVQHKAGGRAGGGPECGRPGQSRAVNSTRSVFR